MDFEAELTVASLVGLPGSFGVWRKLLIAAKEALQTMRARERTPKFREIPNAKPDSDNILPQVLGITLSPQQARAERVAPRGLNVSMRRVVYVLENLRKQNRKTLNEAALESSYDCLGIVFADVAEAVLSQLQGPALAGDTRRTQGSIHYITH